MVAEVVLLVVVVVEELVLASDAIAVADVAEVVVLEDGADVDKLVISEEDVVKDTALIVPEIVLVRNEAVEVKVEAVVIVLLAFKRVDTIAVTLLGQSRHCQDTFPEGTSVRFVEKLRWNKACAV